VYAYDLPLNAEVTLRKSGGAIFVHVVIPALSRPGICAEGTSFYIDESTVITGVKLALRLPENVSCEGASQLGNPLEIAIDENWRCISVKLEPFKTYAVVRFDLIGKR
jgi:hypothetical protein